MVCSKALFPAHQDHAELLDDDMFEEDEAGDGARRLGGFPIADDSHPATPRLDAKRNESYDEE